MASNRTYGIEIEAFSNIGAISLATKINEAFITAGLGHSVRVMQRYGRTSGYGNIWEIKPDGSLRATPQMMRNNYKGVEVVSPILRGDDGFKALKVVCDVLQGHCKINSTAGLHVHHGVSDDEMRKVAAAWIKAEDVVFRGLPQSRQNNMYCKRWSRYVRSMRDLRVIDREKKMALNISSVYTRGTVEFRCAGGSIEFRKIKNWALFTQGLIERAIEDGGAPHFATARELADWVAPNRGAVNVSYRPGTLKAQLAEFLAVPRSWNEVKAHFGRQMSKEKKALERDGVLMGGGGYWKVGERSVYADAAEWFVGRVEHFAGARAAA